MRARWVPLVLILACEGSELEKGGGTTTTWTTPTTESTTKPVDSGTYMTPEDTGPCVFPVVDQAPADPTADVMDTPQYLGVRFTGIGFDRTVVDFTSEFNGDATATVDFVFYDADIREQCIVRYDASLATPVNPFEWPTDSGGELYAAWELDLLSDGWTDCGMVDEFAGFGGIDSGVFVRYTDLRDWIEELQWGFGLGQLLAVESRLAEVVTEGGGNWAADWAPYVFGFYVWTGDENIYELGYTFAGAHDCGVIDEASAGTIDPIPEPLGPPMEDFYIGSQFFVFDLFADPTFPTGDSG